MTARAPAVVLAGIAFGLVAGCAQPCEGKGEPRYISAWSEAVENDGMRAAFERAGWTVAPESSVANPRDAVDATKPLADGSTFAASWSVFPGHSESELVVRSTGGLTVATDKEARDALESPLAGLRGSLATAIGAPVVERYMREGGPCPPGTQGEVVETPAITP